MISHVERASSPSVRVRPQSAGQINDEQRGVERVLISSLLASDSPRLAGENNEHVRTLVELGAQLPPITVHRSTMRVIDGMHRVKAAMLRREDFIDAYLVDADLDEVFVLAVEANVAHGLPLTLADRKAAAMRIMRSHQHWSDRAIAAKTALSPKTVAALRRRPTEENPQLATRVGRDGRVRPLGKSPGRRIAAELLETQPEASLRQIARAAGISPMTVRKVREELRDGTVPDETRPVANPDGRETTGDRRSGLLLLRSDPSVRFTDSGRKLLRLLDLHAISVADWERLIDDLPEHCVDLAVDVARACASKWEMFTTLLEQRSEHRADREAQ